LRKENSKGVDISQESPVLQAIIKVAPYIPMFIDEPVSVAVTNKIGFIFKFVTDALKARYGVEKLRIDDSRLLMFSPGKGVDYQVDVVLGDDAQGNKKLPEVRCCIWITPEKEEVFYNSFETWNEERVPDWSEW